MTRLSVNINKIATIRNARGGKIPDVLQVAKDCESFGADGITVHPRPDERHIRYSDVREISPVIKTEFNIEGYPSSKFLSLVEEVNPHQVTLVPDGPNVLTSNAGWDTLKNKEFLTETISGLQRLGIRVSVFVDPIEEIIKGAAQTGTDRIELYTESYASEYKNNPKSAIKDYLKSAKLAKEFNLGLNAGHDLDLNNLAYFNSNIPRLDEVSIGHALISDALYFGLENTIQMYKRKLLK